MSNINTVTLSGNIVREPELRATATGSGVLNFTIAVNERRKNQQTGEWEDYVNFIDCVMFGKRAESVSRYIHKGSKIALNGKLHWNQWENEGQKRSKVGVVVSEIEILSDKNAPNAASTEQPVANDVYAQNMPF